MLNRRQGLRAAFFASLITAGGGSLVAQQTETVGPPVLKDFQLEGQRTTPPAQPAPTTTAPTTAPAPEATPPSSTPSAERPAPRPTRPIASTRRATRQAAPVAPAPVVAEPAPAERTAAPAPAAGTPLPSVQPTPNAQPPVQASPSTATSDSGWSWLWLALPIALGLLALLALRRRRRDAENEVEVEAEAEAEQSAAELPAVAATPVAPALEPELSATAAMRAVSDAPRARLEIEFRPERAAATESEAVVNFEMVLRNLGDAEAGNIRIDSRMFNAKDEQEIEAFLKGPIHQHSGSPQITILPGDTLSLASAIKLPTSELREIELHGRRLFVPVAAINVAYDWADGGKGRTSRSWVIGREAEQPSEKMGGFRLDLGPRIYRSVGQRPTKLAHVA